MDTTLLDSCFDFYKKKLQENVTLDISVNSLSEQGKQFYSKTDAPRVFSSLYLHHYVKKYNIKSSKLLTWCGVNDVEKHIFPMEQWDDINYDSATGKNDVQNFDLETKDYDLIWLTQILEHVVEVRQSIENIFKHLKSGGYFYANWPVLNTRHAEPFHFYTGITVTCILYCCAAAGFELLECGTWGNVDYITKMFKNQNPSWQTWPTISDVDHKNDDYCPCIGWVLTRKP